MRVHQSSVVRTPSAARLIDRNDDQKEVSTFQRVKGFFLSFIMKTEDDGKVKWGLRYNRIFRLIPVINFFFDLFFDDTPPSPESAKSLLDVIGLINALLLATLGSIVGSVNYDELLDADARYASKYQLGADPVMKNYTYGHQYKEYWDTYYTLSPSNQLYFDLTTSMGLFFIGLLSVVYVYTDMIGKSGSLKSVLSEKMEQEELQRQHALTLRKEDSDAVMNYEDPLPARRKLEVTPHISQLDDELFCFQDWWAYAKFSLFAVVGSTLIGSLYTTLACNVIFAIKYPDYYIQIYGKMSADPSCPTGYANYFFKAVGLFFGIVVVVTCGIGTANKYYREEELRERRANRMLLGNDDNV